MESKLSVHQLLFHGRRHTQATTHQNQQFYWAAVTLFLATHLLWKYVIEGISDHSIDVERCYEFDNSYTSVHSVKGRLKDHFNFWPHDLGASDFILQIISNGYAIPFVTIPPYKAFFRNNNSAVKEAGFVSEAHQELVHSGCVVEVSTSPHVVNPLSVSIQSTGKKRLILDLRHANFHVWKEKFKFEDIRTACNYLPHDQFMFKFDLKSGYHHLDILQEHQTFLGFSWVINGIRKYFYCPPLWAVLSSIYF